MKIINSVLTEILVCLIITIGIAVFFVIFQNANKDTTANSPRDYQLEVYKDSCIVYDHNRRVFKLEEKQDSLFINQIIKDNL